MWDFLQQLLKDKDKGQDEDGQVLDPAVVRAKLIEVMEGMENQWDDDEGGRRPPTLRSKHDGPAGA